MPKMNEYDVDNQASEKVLELLRKVAGTAPDLRMLAYERMIEILRYEQKQEEEKYDNQLAQRECEEQELDGSCLECRDGDLLNAGQTCPNCNLTLNEEGLVIS